MWKKCRGMELRTIWWRVESWSLESDSSANRPIDHDVCLKSFGLSLGRGGALVVLGFKPMAIEPGNTSESFGNFGDADSWYQYQTFDTESWGWSPRNWYFPIQMHKVSQWLSYIDSVENHCSVGLHSLGWKGRKTTYNLSVVWETFICAKCL